MGGYKTKGGREKRREEDDRKLSFLWNEKKGVPSEFFSASSFSPVAKG